MLLGPFQRLTWMSLLYFVISFADLPEDNMLVRSVGALAANGLQVLFKAM